MRAGVVKCKTHQKNKLRITLPNQNTECLLRRPKQRELESARI